MIVEQAQPRVPVLLTPREVTAMLRLKSTTTLRRWRKLGKGPLFLIIGTRPRYPLDEIEKWLAARARAGEQ